MKRINTFNLITLGYLYLPIIIFLLTWINPVLGYPEAIVVCYLIWQFSANHDNTKINFKRIWIALLVSLAILLSWALLSGLGGFFLQSFDWQKHNVLLNDLINKPWPVHYYFKGHDGVISYYIGEYLLPAIIGKIAGFNCSQLFLLIWVVTGLALLVLSIYKWINRQSGWAVLAISFSLIMFAPFIYPLSGIFATWDPGEYSVMGEMGEWFNLSFKAQYTSNISLLRFVFPQFVPVALAVSIWLRNLKNYKVWGIILAPIALYSTFAFVGLGALMFLSLINDCFHKFNQLSWREVFSNENILAIIVMITLLLYIACNIVQPKPTNGAMHFAFANVWGHKLAFLTLQGSWIIWTLLLLKYENKNSLLYISSLILFVLPFFKFGAANDLVMRVSIPALLTINLLVIKNIVQYWNKDRYFAVLMVGALVVSGAGPLWQLKNAAINHNIHSHTYNMPYKTGNEFFKSDKNVVYQYVDWSQSNLRKIIIRK